MFTTKLAVNDFVFGPAVRFGPLFFLPLSFRHPRAYFDDPTTIVGSDSTGHNRSSLLPGFSDPPQRLRGSLRLYCVDFLYPVSSRNLNYQLRKIHDFHNHPIKTTPSLSHKSRSPKIDFLSIMSAEFSEQLLESFKAAALSVTKLYRASTAANEKARADGYQDCLDDLLTLLDRENIGLEGTGGRVRRWATERVESGRDTVSTESDEEVDKAHETVRSSSPEAHRSSSTTQITASGNEDQHMRDSALPSLPTADLPSPTPQPLVEELPEIPVPTQEVFSFQSSISYPQDPYMRLANLDLSDTRQEGSTMRSNISTSTRVSRNNRNLPRAGSRPRQALGQGAGQKRKIPNLAELFDISPDLFSGSRNGNGGRGGGGAKRSKHA